MHSFMRSSISSSYNPDKNNKITDINKSLRSRNTVCQKKACEFIIAEINRYDQNNDRQDLIKYLLENNSVYFLCEATGNMDFSLIRLILHCMRLLWSERQYFEKEPAAQSMSAVLRVLAHYICGGEVNAVNACLKFLYDLLERIKHIGTTSPLCHQSDYSPEQLLACFKNFASKKYKDHTSIMLSGLVIHALISYKPSNLIIASSTAKILVEVIIQWFALLLGALNTSSLAGEDISRKFFVLVCQIGMDSLGLTKVLKSGYNQKIDFVQKIIINEDEVNVLTQCSIELNNSAYDLILELVTVNKNYQDSCTTEEYKTFLEFFLSFLYEHSETETLSSFCEELIKEGYLTTLPKQVMSRKSDGAIRKLSTLILGEILKSLSEKYLKINTQEEWDDEIFVKHINIGLSDIQYGLEKPESIGTQLMKEQPYSLLIYMYFYCQSSDSFQEATPSLLPHLINHILRLPECPYVPPPYIIKVLWLVFAMSVNSADFPKWCLEEKVRLEKATERLVKLLRPDSSWYYTHNPAILRWAYTSLRIPRFIRLQVLKQWLSLEEFVPICLIKRFAIQKDLVDVLLDKCDFQLASNCIRIIQNCADNEESFEMMANLVWSMLPKVLSDVLIKINEEIDSSTDYLLDLASLFLPQMIKEGGWKEVAQLVAVIFSKSNIKYSKDTIEIRYHHEIVYLKLARILLNLSCSQNNNGVLLTYLNRDGFLTNVLTAIHSLNDKVACEALHLLYYIVYYFNTNNFTAQPLGQVLGLQTHLVIQHLRRDGSNERGVAMLRLVQIILDSGSNTPLALTYDVLGQPTESQQCNMLKALTLRIQMLCCMEGENESSNVVSIGWKTLNSLYKYASNQQNDPKLLRSLTSQPWIWTLIQFQLKKNVMPEEFLVFLNNWLILINKTLKEIQEKKPRQICQQSMMSKTLIDLLKHFLEEKDKTELKGNILELLKDVLTSCGFNMSLEKTTI